MNRCISSINYTSLVVPLNVPYYLIIRISFFFKILDFIFMTHLTVGLVFIYISRYPVGYAWLFFWSDIEVPFVKTDGYV